MPGYEFCTCSVSVTASFNSLPCTNPGVFTFTNLVYANVATLATAFLKIKTTYDLTLLGNYTFTANYQWTPTNT